MVEASLVNMVQTIGILVGIGIALFQLRELNITRKRELVLQRLQISNLEYWDAWADVMNMEWDTVEEFFEKYGIRNNPRAFAKWNYVMFTYQSLGAMLKEGLIDPDHFFEVYGPIGLLLSWVKNKPVIQYFREGYRYPDSLGNIEYLANVIRAKYPEMSTENIRT